MVEAVPEYISFPKEEEKTLEFWTKHDTFKNSLKQSKGKPRYSFYDGPPFATGLPHYGHILAGTIKDTVTRFAHQSGYHVERRFGWDCHGLPVEYEIDKTLGIKGPEDVAKMGVAAYNKECRSIVMRYSGEWERIVNRLGRWIDFRNDYKTLYPWFMESVWWVFKQLYDKGFVYSGFKVMPYSTGCSTPLSNFEASQNYKEVNDPAVIVNFPLDEDPNVKVLAWTTTPWTLPSNLALCVHPDMIYVKVTDKNTHEIYILLEARLISLYKSEEEYEIIERFPGKNLYGKGYKPLFPYFSHMKSQGAFRVLTDTYVTDDSGTGVVHQAPFFGADDYRVCSANGIIKKDGKPICPVDATGKFTAEVSDFKGQYVKDADKNICKFLKEAKRLVHQGTTKHSYPFCWRSDTPLLYKAVPSWFVRVEQMTENLLSSNNDTYWVPDFVKEKRFANWLRDAHDWAISRNRYWGTPIPLWTSDDMEEVVCVGSIQDLENLSGVKVTDIHRESVDHITIPSRMGKGVLRRIDAVFDCWFESGSMPYAQMHYPFENKKEFEDSFPANFIAEGIDQTRGWFYTLIVLSTALFGKPPFKNLIVNGLVLAEDGQKMSKRKKNYPDPMGVVNSYGADALRLYLINSPVVRAENLRFKETGVKDVLKDVFLPWYNAYRFLVQNILRFEKDEGLKFEYKEDKLADSTNIMDRWIISCIQSLVCFVKEEMNAYRLYTVVPRLVKFVDLLTNWYVRSNRRRIKGENGVADCELALQTLFSVLMTLIRLMSPFTPYLTEHIYQNLKQLIPGENDKEDTSIHYLMLPEVKTKLVDVHIEKAVSRMQSVIELGRGIRDRKVLPNKYPLQEVVIIHKSNEYLDDVKSLEKYIMEELNVRKITLSGDKDRYGITLKAEPDHVLLGRRLKGAFKEVSHAIQKLTVEEIERFVETGSIEVCGFKLEQGELRLIYQFETLPGVPAKYEARSDNDVMVLLDVTPDQTLLDEGVAREIVNRIQKLRKTAKLVPTDDVTVYYDASTCCPSLQKIAESHSDFIQSLIRSPLLPYPVSPFADIIIESSIEMKQGDLGLALVRGHSDGNEVTEGVPFCRYTNVEIVMNGNSSCNLSVLLENPRNNPVVTDYRQFTSVISRAFFDGCPMTMVNDVNINFDAVNGAHIIAEVTKKRAASSVEGIFSDACRTFVSLTFDEEGVSLDTPISPFVNVVYMKNTSQGPPALGTVLLENPPMCNKLDVSRLKKDCSRLFGRGVCLYTNKNCATQLSSTSDLNGRIIYCKEDK